MTRGSLLASHEPSGRWASCGGCRGVGRSRGRSSTACRLRGGVGRQQGWLGGGHGWRPCKRRGDVPAGGGAGVLQPSLHRTHTVLCASSSISGIASWPSERTALSYAQVDDSGCLNRGPGRALGCAVCSRVRAGSDGKRSAVPGQPGLSPLPAAVQSPPPPVRWPPATAVPTSLPGSLLLPFAPLATLCRLPETWQAFHKYTHALLNFSDDHVLAVPSAVSASQPPAAIVLLV